MIDNLAFIGPLRVFYNREENRIRMDLVDEELKSVLLYKNMTIEQARKMGEDLIKWADDLEKNKK